MHGIEQGSLIQPRSYPQYGGMRHFDPAACIRRLSVCRKAILACTPIRWVAPMRARCKLLLYKRHCANRPSARLYVGKGWLLKESLKY